MLFASGLKHISIYTGCGRRLWCARASAHLPNPAPSDGPGADGFAMPLELERLLLTGSSMSAYGERAKVRRARSLLLAITPPF